MVSSAPEIFSMPPELVSFSALLFDLDGTIIDSTEAIEKHWHAIGNELGVDPAVILKSSHGRRTIDTLRQLDPSRANWEYVSHVEGLIPKKWGDSAVEIPGARSLISSLGPLSVPWAIVTSATAPLVTGWLERLALPKPQNLVVAENVENGKPDPACYRMGLEKLHMQERAPSVLVLEDSPAGIRAGKAAGCRVLAVVTSHTVDQVVDAGPDWVVRDLGSVRVVGLGGRGDGVVLEIRDALLKP